MNRKNDVAEARVSCDHHHRRRISGVRVVVLSPLALSGVLPGSKTEQEPGSDMSGKELGRRLGMSESFEVVYSMVETMIGRRHDPNSQVCSQDEQPYMWLLVF